VIDIDALLNPESMRSMLSHLQDHAHRQEPDYRVGFVETPDSASPYGVRSYAEHGIIGMPAALGNALSTAFGMQLNTLPLTPETIWRTRAEGAHDTV
jgi:hypothetical protein